MAPAALTYYACFLLTQGSVQPGLGLGSARAYPARLADRARCRARLAEAAPQSAPEAARRAAYADAWYAVAFDAHTQREAPVPITLLGTPVVLWYDGPRGAWSAAVDRCPHRLAPLSEGRVDGSGHIECPYHGWAFDHDGACTRLPQLDGPLERARPHACATALRAVTRDGIIWLWAAPLLGSRAAADEGQLDRFLVDAIRAPGCVHLDYSRDLPMDASTLLENVLDPSHLPFTHHGTISRRSAAGPVPLRLVDGGVRAGGFTLERLTANPGRVAFVAPHHVLSRTERPGSYTDWNVVYATPLSAGRCRLLVRICFQVERMPLPMAAALSTLARLPAAASHLVNHAVLEDDNVFLHAQERALALDGAAELAPAWQARLQLPTSADAGVVAYRRWLDEFTHGYGAFGPGGAAGAARLPAALPREQLVERLRSHTEHCAECARLLRWARRARALAPAVQWAGLAGCAALLSAQSLPAPDGGVAAAEPLARLLAHAGAAFGVAPLLCLSAAGLALAYGGAALEGALTQGSYPPPRNDLRGR